MISPHSFHEARFPQAHAARRRRGPALALTLAALLVGGCTATIEDPPFESQPALEAPAPDYQPGVAGLRRITSEQYRHVVRDVFGADVVPPPQLEPDIATGGLFEVGAGLSSISSRGVDLYESGAFSIAAQILEEETGREAFVGCAPAGTVDDDCARQHLGELGPLLWRRPLTEPELDGLVAIAADAASTLGDFHDGLEYAIATLLQAPSFIYRRELGEPDPANPGWRKLTPYELASRMAFFMWNSGPDQELLDAAASGALASEEGRAAQVDRLLADQRARDGVKAFFADMLKLSELDGLQKDPNVFIHFSPDVATSAKEETLLTVEHLVFEQNADFRDFLTTRTTFVDRRLAAIYDIPAPVRDGFGQTELPEDEMRRGYLGQLSFLATNAHPTRSSATLRGKFIREVLLCREIPPPPAMANVAIPEPSPDSPTLRDRVKIHLEAPVCRGCHQLMDPVGLAFEQFDGLGRFRDMENGAFIDPSGSLNGEPFDDSQGLAWILHDDPDFSKCIVRTMYRYATGHIEQAGETLALRELTRRYEELDYRILDLMREMALHPSFRQVVAAQGTVEAP